MKELFKIIRESCSSLIWSRAVEIARQNGVIAESLSPEEAVLRVASPGRAVSATVRLWIDEEDWLCDCGNTQPSPCEHIAAAIIAMKRAKDSGATLSVSRMERGLVRYYFFREGKHLRVERRIFLSDSETVVSPSLAAISSGRVSGPAVNASKEDMTIDGILAKDKSALPDLSEVIGVLRKGGPCFFEDKIIKVGEPISGLRFVIRDKGENVYVVLQRDPNIEEQFANGAAILDGTLRPVVIPDLSLDESRLKTEGREFSPPEFAELVGHLIPQWKKHSPVVEETSRLPKLGSISRPRLVMQTRADGELLSVLPLIVYGDPPCARVDSGRLVMLDKSAPLPERNLAAENRLANSLHAEFGFSVGRRMDFRGDAAAKFADRLGNWKGAVLGNALNVFSKKISILPSLTMEGQQLKLEFRVPGEAAPISTERVLASWREGQERMGLGGESGWAPLPVDWLERYGSRVLRLLEAQKETGKIPRYAYAETALLCEDLDTPCPPEFSKLRRQLEQFDGIPKASLPKDLTASLRGYQRRGVDWLSFMRSSGLGALLADDMGLGKTLQALASFPHSGKRAPILIVVPTSVLANWEREVQRFRPKLSVSLYHGSTRKLDLNAHITLTSYALLRLDIEALADVEWDTVVLDEAQNIRNPLSQVAQAAFRLRTPNRIALTGTPIENRLDDLWSIFHFLNPGLLGGRDEFQTEYSAANFLRNPQLSEVLRQRLKPFILRRLKGEVAPELPPRTDLVLYVDLEPAEREAYEAIHIATRNEVAELLTGKANVLAALECLLRLRQAACHPALLPGQAAEDSSKVRLLVETLEEVVSEGHKAIVFSQWTSLLDLIEPHLREINLEFGRIDGSTRDRAGVVDKFQSESGYPLLLMTLKAGGVGLNLTAADHVFLVDPWWNPAAEDQAADRAHRIGQTRPVFVHRLVARNTVEEKILALQERKRATAQAALSGADQAIGITSADLLELLS